MNKVVAVFSPSGGVGVSTIAVHLARSFAEKYETALVDTHPDFSSIGKLLKTNASLPQDRLPVAITMNSPFIQELTIAGQSKLKYFPAPPSTVPDTHDWKNHFSNCQRTFQFSVLDLPSTFLAPELEPGLDIADKIVLVIENHWSKISCATAFLEKSPDSVRDKCQIVANKTAWLPKAVSDEIHENLGRRPVIELPMDQNLVGNMRVSQSGPFSVGVKSLATKIREGLLQS